MHIGDIPVTAERGNILSTDSRSIKRPQTAAGWIIFAFAIMFIVGAIDIIQGIAAIVKPSVFLVSENGLLLANSFDGWGWALLVWGIVLVLVSIALLAARGIGRWAALVIVIINLLGQAAWFPAHPLWCLIAMALSVGVIWALTAGWPGEDYTAVEE